MAAFAPFPPFPVRRRPSSRRPNPTWNANGPMPRQTEADRPLWTRPPDRNDNGKKGEPSRPKAWQTSRRDTHARSGHPSAVWHGAHISREGTAVCRFCASPACVTRLPCAWIDANANRASGARLTVRFVPVRRTMFEQRLLHWRALPPRRPKINANANRLSSCPRRSAGVPPVLGVSDAG